MAEPCNQEPDRVRSGGAVLFTNPMNLSDHTHHIGYGSDCLFQN